MKMNYLIFFLFFALFKFEITDYIESSKILLNLPDPEKKSKKREKNTIKIEKKKTKEALNFATSVNLIPDDEKVYEAYKNMDANNESAEYLKNKIEENSLKFKNIFRLIL